MTERLRVVIATPLAPELVESIARDERLDVVWEPELLTDPSADWMVGPKQRTPEQQARYEQMLDSAEALFGVPDHSGRALGRTVAANPRLRWVHTIPAGGGQQVKAAHLAEADLARVLFTTSAGVHAGPLAEFALFGVLAGAKRLPWLTELKSRRQWGPREPLGMLADSTVLVVGLGGIGRVVASRLRALGCRVVGVHRREVEAEVDAIVPVEAFADAAAEADAIVLALPGTEQTRGMLSAEVLAAVKPGITVVNVGRGTTVDEDALVAALRDGRVGLAVLDVAAVEPLPEESPLWELPNVVLAPHAAALSPHEPRLIAELFAENARRLLDGEPLLNVVNTREFY